MALTDWMWLAVVHNGDGDLAMLDADAHLAEAKSEYGAIPQCRTQQSSFKLEEKTCSVRQARRG